MKRGKNMKFKRVAAALTAIGCFAASMSTLPSSFAQATEFVNNDFEVNYDGWYADSPEFTAQIEAIEGIGANGSRGMKISERTAITDGAASEKGFYLYGGQTFNYNVSVFSESAETFRLSLMTQDIDDPEQKTEVELVSKKVAAGKWTTLSASYAAPVNSGQFRLLLTTDSTADFVFDDVVITGPTTAKAAASDKGLKDMLVNFGIRSGNILNGTTVNNNTIKDILLKDCNAIECENETKPDATLVQNGSTNSDIKVRSNSFAAIADFCVHNNLGFRGHTLVWHSQTPQWFFKDNFQDGGNWVSESVMEQRLESYIKNMFAMFASTYPKLNLYAYDVCNECMNDSNGGPRNGGYGNGASPWVQIYKDNHFIDSAFKYARMYAPKSCHLFYNDYNEFAGFKRDAILTTAKRIKAAGNLDGVGMQSHIGADPNAGWDGENNYLTAMKMYLQAGLELQVTELDISRKNHNNESDQTKRFVNIYKTAMDWNSDASHTSRVTLLQVWGPNDNNTWLGSGTYPTLYDGSNQPKAPYTALTQLVPQSQWGDGTKFSDDFVPVEPDPIEPDADGYWLHATFENGTDGFGARISGESVSSSSAQAYAGSKSLYVTNRSAAYEGAAASISYGLLEAGKAYSFSGAVKLASGSADVHFTMQYNDGETQYVKIDTQTVTSDSWVQLSNTAFKVPNGASDIKIYFECDDEDASFYVDEVIIAPEGTKIEGPGKGKSLLIGDVDCNGTINAADLTLLKRGIKTGKWAGRIEELAADVDQSGEIDATDAQLLRDFLITKIKKFPVAERKVDFSQMEQMFQGVSLAKSWKMDNENNPLTTQRFGADPGWLVYDGRLYVYTTNDAFEYNGNSMKENSYNSGTINCVSSADLVNWTDHGAIPVAARNGRTTNGVAKWASNAWAPDACWKMIDGKPKFFLYFANNGSGVGVLTSDSPTGPFIDPLGHELVSKSNTPNMNDVVWMFDPGVYYDEATDEAYLCMGGGVDGRDKANPKTGRMMKLGKDLISVDTTTVKVTENPYLFEDSSLIKIGNTWYYSYCANWNVPGGTNINGVSFGNADILYMCNTNPLGDWGSSQLKGNVFKNTGSQGLDNGGNNHHSIIMFKDQYYVLYHCRKQEMRMGVNGGSGFNYRSTQINKADYNASTGQITCKGSMAGVDQLEYLNPFETVQAETMAQQAGIEISGLSNTVVTNIQTGDWIKLKGVDFGTGCKSLTVKVKSSEAAAIKVTTGGPSGDAFAYVEIPAGTNGEITVPTLNVSGVKDVSFVFKGSFDFDSWKLS